MLCQTRVQEFFDFYQKLDKNCTKDLHQFYAEQIIFTDPLHQVQGLDALVAYFDKLYARVTSIEFEFDEPDLLGERCWCSWVMTYSHPRINGGKPVRVDGVSRLDWQDGKVIRHRDFFDAGQMLYEKLPLLGGAIRWLQGRMAV